MSQVIFLLPAGYEIAEKKDRMKNRYYNAVILIVAMVVAMYACTSKVDPNKYKADAGKAPLSEADRQLVDKATAVFGKLQDKAENPDNVLNDNKIMLGKMLYFEPRLSKSGWISCNSCHNLATYGVDNLPTSLGHQWHSGDRNAPTTLNAAFHFVQFWDGRAKDVEAQAKGPVLNPVEMASPHEQFVVDRIASMEAYMALFAKAFPGQSNALNYDNIANAIGAFERTLVVPSRFDAFLNGSGDALNDAEKKGLLTFINTGCTTCHMGPTLGGSMYQKFGVHNDYWTLTGSKSKDAGRMAVTKNEADRYFFKVPSLRNIEHTYPYFHDGSVWELDKAVAIMAETQLGKTLSPAEVSDIVAFLNSLTGTVPAAARELPQLPASNPVTTKPEVN